jgi:Carboxypeptidase regulatory-like domain/TonB dependent receptor
MPIRILILTICSLGILSAQDSRGRVNGRVTDSSGGVLPNIEVTITNIETGVKATGTTNTSGNYDLPYLQPGIYTMAAASPGFKTFAKKGVEVRVGDRLSIDIGMEVGQVTESVTVSGETSLLEGSTASVGRVVDSKRILDLPLPGGNALSLARLAPGVVNLAAPNHPSLGPAVEVMSNVSVNGVRSGNTEFTVDGTPSMWGTNAAFAPPTELVAEFKVQTAAYDASIGRSPGGNINVVLRSGTNQLYASLYWFHNNQHLQTLDIFQRQSLYNPSTGPVTDAKIATVNPRNILNRVGATVSGPVVVPKVYDGRNKTFWIFSFEELTRPGVERGNTFFTVPTTPQRLGDFSGLLKLGANYQIYDPMTTVPAAGGLYTRQPIAGNIIPQSRLDKTALGLLKYWPDPNLAGTSNGLNNYQRFPTSYNEYRTYTEKIDHNFNEKHRLFGRYSQWYQLFSSGQTFDNPANGNDRYRYNYGGVLDDVYVLSPTLVNNVRLGLTRFEQSSYPLTRGFDLTAAGFSPKLAAAIDPQAYTFPNMSIAGYQAIGTSSISRTFSNYFTASDGVSWTKGNHMLRFGAEFRVYREHSKSFANSVPSESFASTYTGGPSSNSPAAPIGQGLASYLLGLPTGGSINVNDSFADQSKTTAFYVQDDWRVNSRLTVNIGLRYDYDSPMTERYNRSVRSFDFNAANPIAAQAIAAYAKSPLPELAASQFKVNGGLTFAGANGQPRELWATSKTNFAPRVGLAWTPLKSTVLRAGYGLFYVPLGADRTNANQTGYTLVTSLTASLDNGQTYVASLANPFPNGWPAPPGNSQGLSTFLGRNVSFFKTDTVNPYMQRWSFSIQQQLPKLFLLDITYLGNRGTRLAANRQYDPIPNSALSKSMVRDQATINFLNATFSNPFFPLPGSNIAGTTVARSQLLRPYPQFTGITGDDPQGYSWYHSLQVVGERRFRQGYTFQANYTWSKMMEATGYLNGGDAMPEKVISDLDRTHRFSLSGIYELPFGKGKKYLAAAHPALRHVAGGWQLQLTAQMNSGMPLAFGNSQLLTDIGTVPLGSGQTLDRWFNTAAFNRDSTQQLASNVRTLSTRFAGVRAPGVQVWDISAVKNFSIHEKWRVQFRAEMLNAMNHSNLNPPNLDPASTLFGSITSTPGYPRFLHLGLKIIY